MQGRLGCSRTWGVSRCAEEDGRGPGGGGGGGAPPRPPPPPPRPSPVQEPL
jgi:hypothetical protein